MAASSVSIHGKLWLLPPRRAEPFLPRRQYHQNLTPSTTTASPQKEDAVPRSRRDLGPFQALADIGA
ncbi:hypothetical protein PIB30_010796 [Stylosanthes scabra]|uniref:Uncharacterized protein n=1 Tax=Stylosanthes scabra TaxID=79078 RepID=A0ABU6Z686_9FABA|nr:hypothetical protein [Stylosanthes scabra]